MKRLLLHGLLVAIALALVPTASARKKRRGKAKPVFKEVDTKAEVVLQDTIKIRIHGLASSEGWVVCRIYDKKGWLKSAVATVMGEIERRGAICEFEGLRPGTYAVAAFHDENKNGEPDDNGLGQPGEGVCTTGNVKEIKVKPPFKKAKFTYAGGVLTKSTRMQYLQ